MTTSELYPRQLPQVTTVGGGDRIVVQPAAADTEVSHIIASDFADSFIRPIAEAAPAGRTRPAARSVSLVRADRVNVADYGAVMDGAVHPVTDAIGSSGTYAPGRPKWPTFSALQTDMPWVLSTSDSLDWALITQAVRDVKASIFRGGTWKQCGSPMLYQPGSRKAVINRTLFFGTDRDGPAPDSSPSFIMDIKFEGLIQGAYDHALTADRIGINLSGTRFGRYHFNFAGDPIAPPDVMCYLARGGLTDLVTPTFGRSSDDFMMDHVFLDGSAKICALKEYAAEDVFHHNCTYRVDGGGARACVIITKGDPDATPDLNQTHPTAGLQQTYVGGKFDKCYLYYDMPAGSVPAGFAPLIVDGSGRHTYIDMFLSQVAGDTTRGPHVILIGADAAGNSPSRQAFIRPHFHGPFGDGMQLKQPCTALLVEQPFENTGRPGAGTLYFTVHAFAGANILRGSRLDVESIQTEPTAGLTQTRLTMLTTPGVVNINGGFTGQLIAFSTTPVLITGVAGVDYAELDTGVSYRLSSTGLRAAPTAITSADNRAPVTITAAGQITVGSAALLGPRFMTDVLNDTISGDDCPVAMPDGNSFSLPYHYVLNISVQNGKVWTFVGPSWKPPI